ncbi:MAG TPA: SGNH/GDSL hydrolase family protein [Steroidobacter sp.]|uniref:SGNH/GDSL hydrolase family protein n=1 Tax=Steroidobacter sp. TaxID=1978227 RepID=UPI002ED87976
MSRLIQQCFAARRAFVAVVLLPLLMTVASCGKQGGEQESDMSVPLTDAEIAAVASQRIVFAHQSVGNNILEGVQSLTGQHGKPLTVVESRQAPEEWQGIAHFKVGENGKPLGKIEQFAQIMNADGFAQADVAMLKLCYIDFDGGATDPEKLAASYGDTLAQLQSRYPQTRFVAMTVPLTTIQTGPKAWVKKLLGRAPAGYEDNLRRQQFNERLRARFSGDSLFDVARLEASAGTQTFEYQSRQVEALNPSYTYDGGHLNEQGKAVIAAEFVKFLASQSGT